MANQQALRSKIKSVDSTMKITNAMKLIATAKLNKQRSVLYGNKEYAENLLVLMRDVVGQLEDKKNKYLVGNPAAKGNLYLVFSSDLGLCGGYNVNMAKLLQEIYQQEDKVLVIGGKGLSVLKARKIASEYTYKSDHLQLNNIRDVTFKLLTDFDLGKYQTIKIIYTKFVNTVSFEPTIKQLIPVNQDFEKQEKTTLAVTDYEPSSSKLLQEMIPMYLNSMIYSLWLETKVSEQASRRFAMENATDNAEELKEKYLLQFNQARQAAITQEITEIVSGANEI